MKRIILSFTAAFLFGNAAIANQSDANLDEALTADEATVVETLDTTDDFGITDDFGYGHGHGGKKKYFYKCAAYPYNGHHEFWGDGYSKHDAKEEALRRCYFKTQSKCYVKYCKKFNKH